MYCLRFATKALGGNNPAELNAKMYLKCCRLLTMCRKCHVAATVCWNLHARGRVVLPVFDCESNPSHFWKNLEEWQRQLSLTENSAEHTRETSRSKGSGNSWIGLGIWVVITALW
jgi:hypothetical protein